jgi:4-hydroxy-tetrahydrodipicolinate synthase
MRSVTTALHGTGVALVTPFKPNNEVDFEALSKLIDYVISHGVNYVVSLGTTGETPTLTTAEKQAIAAFTVTQVNNRVPVVLGVGGNNTQQLIEDLQHFDLNGITAILSAAPYYNKPSQEGLYAHYKAFAEASNKPILLYNVPGRTGRNMTAETTIRLANDVPNIVGIKEASGDMAQCMEIIKNAPSDFLVVSGDDNLAMAQIACGMHGVISVAANCFPKQFSSLIKHALNYQFKEAQALQYQLLPAYDMLFAENNPAGVKAFLYELGIVSNIVRLPVTPVSNGLQSKIKSMVATLR